jgi:nitrate/nitrite-specific signal transduction histidine kinase
MQLPSIFTRFKRLGLQRRIMLYVTGGLIVVMAAYSAVSLKAVGESTKQVFRERLMLADTAAREIDGQLSDLQLELSNLDDTVTAAQAGNDTDKVAAALQSLRQDWAADGYCGVSCAVTVLSPQGEIIASDPIQAGAPTADASIAPSFRAAIDTHRPVVSDSLSREATGHGRLVLAAPVMVSDEVVAVLLGELDLEKVSDRFAAGLGVPRSGYGLELIDENGVALAATNPEQLWVPSIHFPLVKGLLANRQAGTTTHSMPAGETEPSHIVAFAPLVNAPWSIILEEPRDVALALPRALQDELLVFGGLVLLSGLVLAWLTTGAVVRPVNALIDATQQIARGDLDHPLDLAADDEVGRLARSFDEMRLELKQSREEIARWNWELEARVRQRTRELSALVKSSQALAETLDLDILFETLIQETRAVVPSAEGIVFFLFEHERDLLTPRSSFGLDAADFPHLGFHKGEGIAGSAFAAPSAIRLDVAEQVRAAQANLSRENAASFQRATGGRPVKSALGAPIVSEGSRLGALVLYNFSREEAFSGNDVTMLEAFANQAAAAIENARLYASLQQKEAARAALLDQTIRAQEEERARVAREIHDELGQLLTRLSIDLKMCESQIAAAEPQRAAQTLSETQTLVWQTIEQAHRLILELRPTLLDELGLEAALREELKTRLEPLGVTPRLRADGLAGRLPPMVEITVFRVVQEAISNIAQHAHAQHVELSLHVADELRLRIEDDGVGIAGDWRTSTDGHRPLGLLGMQERAALVGGVLRIESRAPRGTRVTLVVPLDRDAGPKEER